MDYRDVIETPEELDAMLDYSGGKRKVPVIVQNDTISIGFKGRS